MKQELIDTTVDLYNISRKIKNHNQEFKVKYPAIYADLQKGKVKNHTSVFRLLVKELSFKKNSGK